MIDQGPPLAAYLVCTAVMFLGALPIVALFAWVNKKSRGTTPGATRQPTA